MDFNIRGDKLLVTDAIKEYVTEKLSKLNKYFKDSENLRAHVIVKVRGRDQIIEVTIPTSKFTLRGEEAHSDLYAAIDLVIDKLERQIRKNKTKLSSKMVNDNFANFNLDFDAEEQNEEKIVKRKTLEMKPMSEEEAIIQMELLGHEFFVFKDSDIEKVCVLYKRKEGNYGIIETN